MGLFGGRAEVEPRPEQRWDAISLRDFKSSSCWTAFAYGYLHFDILLSVAVYGVDTFTAINLLAFNTWSSSVPPSQIIPFGVSKWIFSACIIASFVNLILEHIRSWRVRRRGNVAECYLDNLAVRVESTRWGSGQGWRRFLVFAELTKSKKGAEYIALFTYFSFQSWIRVIFCSGPRQAINALSLYSVYELELSPTDNSSIDRSLGSFFDKLGTLYRENNQQAVIFSGMLFTLVVWAFTAIFLLVAVLFYVFFLWHYIPKQDGGLKGYCERKVNKRLKGIVMTKVNKAIAKEEERQRKEGLRTPTRDGEKPLLGRQATLPQLMGASEDELPAMPMLNRNDTMATLPVYTSQPTSPTGLSQQASNATSFSTGNISTRGPPVYRSASPAPSLPAVDWNNYSPMHPPTAGSTRSSGLRGSQASRVGTSVHAFDIPRTASPAVYAPDAFPSVPEPIRSSNATMDTYNGRPMPRQVAPPSGRHGVPRQPAYDDGASDYFAPPPSSSRLPPRRPAYNGPSYNPGRTVTDPAPATSRQPFTPPERTFTAPPPSEYRPPQRGHVAGQRSLPRLDYDYHDDVEAQRNYRRYQ